FLRVRRAHVDRLLRLPAQRPDGAPRGIHEDELRHAGAEDDHHGPEVLRQAVGGRGEADASPAEGLHQAVQLAVAARGSLRAGKRERVQPRDSRSRGNGQACGREERAMNVRTAVAALVTVIAVAAPLAAHHGTNINYDRSKQWTAKAVVTEFKYVNPHAQLFFDVTDESGKVNHWSGELLPNPAQLLRNGWTRKRSVDAMQFGT